MKRFCLILFSFTIFYQCKEKQQAPERIIIEDFSFSSKDINANQPYTITYIGNGELEESFYQQIVHTTAYTYDLIFEDNTATITIPDSVSAVALHLKVDGKYPNNNKKGFLFSVLNKDGKPAVDAEASKQLYTLVYGSEYGFETNAKEVLNTIENALQNEPNLKEEWMEYHIRIANQDDNNLAKSIARGYLNSINSKKELTLEDYESLINIYRNIQDKVKIDSINFVVQEKYPNGKIATNNTINTILKTSDLETKEAIFKSNIDNILKSRDADYVLEHLATSNYRANNADKFEYFVDMMKSSSTKARLFNSLAWSKVENDEDLDWAAQQSKKALELIRAEQATLEEKPIYYSNHQYKNNLQYSFNMYADTHALALFKMGNIKEAISYQEQAVIKNASPDMYERYIEFLIADQQYNTVVEKATTFIEEGKSTSKLKDYFKVAVKKVDNSTDVKGLLASLEVKAKALELKQLRNKLIDDEAPDFTLKNLAGEEVTLSALKGKTVVLDFWATWCGPCIASFPGMQEVVTKYKDDENVAIFFVDTFEDGENRLKSVASFIETNNYDFNVLIDPKTESGSKYLVADQFGITGIPSKIIIGPTGKIKFKSVGFNGSTEKTVSEMDAMIEMVNQPL